MSDIDTKIKQCERDIESLQENLKKLKAEKEQPELKHGDIIADQEPGDLCWYKIVLSLGDGELKAYGLNASGVVSLEAATTALNYTRKVGNLFDILEGM